MVFPVDSAATVAGASSPQQLKALAWLCDRVADSEPDTLLQDALDALVGAAPFRAAAVIAQDGALLAEVGFNDRPPMSSGPLMRALRSLAHLRPPSQGPLRIDDVRDKRHPIEEPGELLGLGCLAGMVAPIRSGSDTVASLVLLMAAEANIGRQGAIFVRAVAAIAARAFPRDARPTEFELSKPAPEVAARTGVNMLSASVAHELRGPVGALVLQLEEQRELIEQLTLFSDSSDTALGGAVAQLDELTSDIEAAVQHVQATASRLSSVGRPTGEPEALDLGTLVEEHLSIARPHFERQGITLHEHVRPGSVVRGRRDELGQVTLTLLFHAADACQLSSTAPEVSVRVLNDGIRVIITVTDTGPGVSDDALQRLFEPFRPEAADDADVDLRLCSDVVTAHGGQIEVVRPPAGPSALRVVLPQLHGIAQSASAVQATNGHQRALGLKQLLVVDDDPVFVRTVRRALKPHEVRSAMTASEAEIAIFDSTYFPDLIVCDIFLPGVNGDELHARVSESRPELAHRFVFITGGALSKTQADYLRMSGCQTMLKPVDFSEIKRLVSGSEGTPGVRRRLGRTIS